MKIIKINAVWCPGCLVMKKIWKQIKEMYPHLDITEYDYDMDKEVVSKYEVGKILPVTIFIKDNEERRLVGEKTKEEIITIIEELQ